MRPPEIQQKHRAEIRAIALRHQVSDLRVFGSVLHGDDSETDDLDLPVEPMSETSLMDIGAIRYELRALIGIEVDVLTPRAFPENFREKMIAEAICRIEQYVQNFGEAQFLSDAKTQDAVICNFEIIGEACNNIGTHHPTFANQHSGTPWAFQIRLGNCLEHHQRRPAEVVETGSRSSGAASSR